MQIELQVYVQYISDVNLNTESTLFVMATIAP